MGPGVISFASMWILTSIEWDGKICLRDNQDPRRQQYAVGAHGIGAQDSAALICKGLLYY